MPLSALNIWILAIRPKTLWAAVSPVILGCAFAKADNGFHLLPALAALFGGLMIQIGTNLANDYFDFIKGSDTNERVGPKRVTQAGLVSSHAIIRATIAAFTLAFIAGIYLVSRGGWPIVTIGLFSILFGVLYTGGPFPLGYNGLGEIFAFIFFGPIAVAGTYYIQALDLNTSVVIAGFAPGLFSVAILTVNNLRDIEGDRYAGKKTLAVRFGAEWTRMQYLLSVMLALQVPLLVVVLNSGQIWAILSLITLPFAFFISRKIFSTRDPEVLNAMLGATGQLMLAHTLLFSLGWLL
ncbi:MAG: 1,4-dihydroxy-2-naphthoate polyprenyltransferase [candidate division Zixibacteria bacterium]|nr:1,4-dihydroxy-2-naphthoate polyprenyltransferase [candidate division Zixibacteria bacterium]